ncbi:MAG: glycosyltransferase family 9 protein [Deltaproteobacteria bacterium]|nr:glycosyltransferase family 9 protein [Deltaproteobacteria bacterium]
MRVNPVDLFLYISMRLLKALDMRKTDIRGFSPEAVKNILVVSSTAIGDTLLSTPAIRAVRERYPDAKITALLNKDNIELFRNNPRIDVIIPYHGGYRKFLRTIRELRKHKFDLALIFHGNEPQATAMCYLSGAGFIFKLPNTSSFNFLLSNREPLIGWDDLGHGIDVRLKTAALAGCRAHDLRMELFIEKNWEQGRERFFKDNGVCPSDILIGLQPGASTLSRQWFPERFIALGKRLSAVPSAKLIITGSGSEKRLCSDIAQGIGKGASVSAGRLNLGETAALIKRLKVLVTGDTGPMHMAIALSTPVVALYAVADPARTGPLYDREIHTVIKKERTCDPCVGKKCEYQKCMEAITVDEVFTAVSSALSLEAKAGA